MWKIVQSILTGEQGFDILTPKGGGLMESNICHFVPYHKDYHSLHTICFVLETKPQLYRELHAEAVCKMYCVSSGRGVLHMAGRTDSVREGDIFFTFPSVPFCIESLENFTYMYVSFTGTRGNMLLDQLKINKMTCIFHDCQEVVGFWKESLAYPSELSGLISESVLLYSFSFLGKRCYSDDHAVKKNQTVDTIKKYIDDHFTDVDFSIEQISIALGYNKKYISSVFKKAMKIGIVEYVNAVRIQFACKMLEQGFTSIHDVAIQCGYQDAQYFSKVFKKQMSMSPEGYKKQLREG